MVSGTVSLRSAPYRIAFGAWVDKVRESTKAEEGGGMMGDILVFLDLFDLNETRLLNMCL